MTPSFNYTGRTGSQFSMQKQEKLHMFDDNENSQKNSSNDKEDQNMDGIDMDMDGN